MSKLDFEPLSKQSLSRQIADQIREAIYDGSLKADDRLPTEDELADRFKVSRPTIREALKRLAAQNLIRTRRGPSGGSFVSNPSVDELSEHLAGYTRLLVSMDGFGLDEISQARRELELVCVRLAAVNRDHDCLATLRQELQIQQDSKLSAEEFCASDVRFHRAIADATGNRMLAFIMHSAIEALQPVANMVAYRFRKRKIIIDQHQRLLAALELGDANAAAAVINEQVDYLDQRQQEAVEWKQQSIEGL